MNEHAQTTRPDTATLAEDVRALIAATADVAGEDISEACKRLAAALDHGEEIVDAARQKAVEGAQATDAAVRAHPYQAIGIALGVGALLGCLVSRKSSRNGD